MTAPGDKAEARHDYREIDLDQVDLTNLDQFKDGFPHAIFERLRRDAPVWWQSPTRHTPDNEGFWVVSRHPDVHEVFTDAQSFSSVTGGDRPYGGTTIQDMPTAGLLLNMMDDPRHSRIRELINKGFTPRHIANLDGELRRRSHNIFDTLVDAGRCDFVVDVARELPAQAICILLGVPQEDRQDLCDWADLIMEFKDRGLGESNDESSAAGEKFNAYAMAMIAEKRAHPGDDILSLVIHASMPDEVDPRLNDGELLFFFLLLFVAGAETTRKAIAGGLKALLEHPEQLQLLRDDPSVMPTAIEEIVRWSTPSVYKRRTVTRDMEFRGQRLRAGDKLTVWEISANRDEEVFDEPFRFDITRSPNPHLGFGQGIHFCLGANLARLEIKILFETLLSRVQDLEQDGAVEWTRDNRLYGLKRLPIRFSKIA